MIIFGVLVILDVGSNRKMLQALLRKHGAMEVDMAENGLEAVTAAMVDRQKYDIIFMDNLMPVLVRYRIAFSTGCIYV